MSQRRHFEDARTSPSGDGSLLASTAGVPKGVGFGGVGFDQSGGGRGNLSFELRLGDELFGRLRPGSRATEWTVTCREIANGWTGKLMSRTSRLYAEDDADWFWVYDIDEVGRRYWVGDSNFGRLPVSDRLRPRYVRRFEHFSH
jgi:hypothetical protein